jgi:hypothetical protein
MNVKANAIWADPHLYGHSVITVAPRASITLRLATENYDVEMCRCATGSPMTQVRVFGEMVSLLWNANPGATICLEDMWNSRNGIPGALHPLYSRSMTCADIAA